LLTTARLANEWRRGSERTHFAGIPHYGLYSIDLLPAILHIDSLQFQKDMEGRDPETIAGLLPWLIANNLTEFASQVR
jgi:hypothetical protein